MNPNPLASLNHFTVPRLRIERSPPSEGRGSVPTDAMPYMPGAVAGGSRLPRRLRTVEQLCRLRCVLRISLQRSCTGSCFESCRVPTLKPVDECEATLKQDFKASLSCRATPTARTRGTVAPPLRGCQTESFS